MQSPPKPWERAAPPSATPSSLASSPSTTSLAASASASASASPLSSYGTGLPPVPNRPGLASSSLTSSPYGSNYGSSYGSSPYGSSYGSSYGGGYGSSYGSSYGSPYGSSYGSSYGSPYSRLGGYGGYGGGYGSSYGSYGGYGGGYGMNRPGFPGQYGMQNNGFMQQVEQGSQQTFGALNALVQAVGGFAQMLESTFFASHSSFMAIMGLMDQFSILRDYLGHALSMVALYRFVRNLFYKMTGRVPPANATDLNPAKFEEFQQAAGSSKKPILIFLAILIGIPLLLSSLVRKTKQKPFEIGPDGRPVLPSGERPEVAKALYPFNGQNQMEISFKPGDEVHVLSRADPRGNLVEWWKGYTVEPNMQGPPRIGMFPGNYVEIVKGNPEVPPRPNQVLQNRGQLPRTASSPTKLPLDPASNPLPGAWEGTQSASTSSLLTDFNKGGPLQ